jgi:hypothetical protein
MGADTALVAVAVTTSPTSGVCVTRVTAGGAVAVAVGGDALVVSPLSLPHAASTSGNASNAQVIPPSRRRAAMPVSPFERPARTGLMVIYT